jgi:Kef-type K+ transport system membrane component KefB
MPEISLTGILIVAAVAFLMPLGLGLIPSVRVPSVVLEILDGVLIGPVVLGLVEVDPPLEVLSLVGLALLLFLAGSEIDLERLRGGGLKGAATGFVLSATRTMTVSSMSSIS